MAQSRPAVLTEWSVLVGSDNPFVAPELAGIRLRGVVTGHPCKADGKTVVTSVVRLVDGRTVTTKNTIYQIVGPPSEEYADWMRENGHEYHESAPIRARQL